MSKYRETGWSYEFLKFCNNLYISWNIFHRYLPLEAIDIVYCNFSFGNLNKKIWIWWEYHEWFENITKMKMFEISSIECWNSAVLILRIAPNIKREKTVEKNLKILATFKNIEKYQKFEILHIFNPYCIECLKIRLYWFRNDVCLTNE